MATKVCSKCKIEKDVDEFSKNKLSADGLQRECKECCKKCHKKWRGKNKEKIKKKAKEWYRSPGIKATTKAYNKQYRTDNKKHILQKQKQYRQENKEIVQKCLKQNYVKNRDKRIEYAKQYREKNRNKLREYSKQYRILPSTKQKDNEWRKARRKENPMFKLNCNVRSSISESLKGAKAGRSWEGLVGYTLTRLKKHLEKLFIGGMSWDNYGEWHIDHKMPMTVFNFTKPEHEDFKKCWALKNLQPLWRHDHCVKNNRIKQHFQPSLLLETK